MEELSGPVVGIALVLSAVFVPTAFIPGITGRLYQQFAVTIAISVILSAFNALTLSPALAALLLRPREESNGTAGTVFCMVQPSVCERDGHLCTRVRRADSQECNRAICCWQLSREPAVFFGSRVPSSFLPDEDQGYFYVNIQLPNAASLQRTDETARQVEKILADDSRSEVHVERDRF